MGLNKKGSDGIRLRSDGKPVVLEMMTTAGSFIPQARIGEMIGQQWKKIGVGVNVIELERALSMGRMRNNEHQLFMWANDGSEILYRRTGVGTTCLHIRCWSTAISPSG